MLALRMQVHEKTPFCRPVGGICEVHLLLKGMVDVSKEVAKIETKIGKLDGQLERLMKAMSIDNYHRNFCLYKQRW